MKKIFTIALLLFSIESYSQSIINSFSNDLTEWDYSTGEYLTKNSYSNRTTLNIRLSEMRLDVGTETHEVIKESRENGDLVIFTIYGGLFYKFVFSYRTVEKYYTQDSNGVYFNRVIYYY